VGVGAGVGVGVGLGVGLGAGVPVLVEPEGALTAPPPQLATVKRREKNSTQYTSFEPMGTVSCTTATLDAAELLNVGLASWMFTAGAFFF
jgi:hypothetical protein